MVDIRLEYLRQTRAEARSHMDLRGRHFSTYLVVSGVLLALVYGQERVTHLPAILAGLAITILYFLMDYRMAQLHKMYLDLSRLYEEQLGGALEAGYSGPRLLRAGLVSELILLIVAALWGTLLVAQLID